MRVFLAGKVDPKLGAWRNALFDPTWIWPEPAGSAPEYRRPDWELAAEPNAEDGNPDYPAWPSRENHWVLGKHHYAGPFVVRSALPTKYTGDFHGNTWTGQHGSMDDPPKTQIVLANRRAIRSADLFFAYLNSPDCYGTLVELGYATACGVYTYLLVGPGAEWEYDDYWYAAQTADYSAELGHTRLDLELTDRLLPYGEAPATPEQETRLVRTAFHHALGEWMARPQPAPAPPPPAPAPPTDAQKRLVHQLLQSYSSIAQWTSDPRVRNEAARMLGVLGAPVPYAPGQRG